VSRIVSVGPLELRLASAENRIEKHVLQDWIFHQIGEVAIRAASEFLSVVFWKFDDSASPKGTLMLMGLLPKVTTPLKVGFVDVQVVSVRKLADQCRRQRDEIGNPLDG